jgi:hypothetical protein
MLPHGASRPCRPGHPYHVTQRGNGRARTFFDDSDYALYRDLLATNCRAAGDKPYSIGGPRIPSRADIPQGGSIGGSRKGDIP